MAALVLITSQVKLLVVKKIVYARKVWEALFLSVSGQTGLMLDL